MYFLTFYENLFMKHLKKEQHLKCTSEQVNIEEIYVASSLNTNIDTAVFIFFSFLMFSGLSLVLNKEGL